MADWRHALSVFRDELAFVMGCAPDQFPVEDYLPPERQPNLDNSFERMQQSFCAFVEAYGQSSDTARWQEDIEESCALFKAGEKLAGKRRLNALYNEIWSTKQIARKRPRRPVSQQKKKPD
jgi:hypothetical protein